MGRAGKPNGYRMSIEGERKAEDKSGRIPALISPEKDPSKFTGRPQAQLPTGGRPCPTGLFSISVEQPLAEALEHCTGPEL